MGNAPMLRLVYLGILEEMGKVRRVMGPYIEDERGYKEGSPCQACQGAYIKGRPFVRTHRRSRSVLKMVARQMRKKGHIYQACQHLDCINPDHLGAVHYWKHQKKDPGTGRFA